MLELKETPYGLHTSGSSGSGQWAAGGASIAKSPVKVRRCVISGVGVLADGRVMISSDGGCWAAAVADGFIVTSVPTAAGC